MAQPAQPSLVGFPQPPGFLQSCEQALLILFDQCLFGFEPLGQHSCAPADSDGPDDSHGALDHDRERAGHEQPDADPAERAQ